MALTTATSDNNHFTSAFSIFNFSMHLRDGQARTADLDSQARADFRDY